MGAAVPPELITASPNLHADEEPGKIEPAVEDEAVASSVEEASVEEPGSSDGIQDHEQSAENGGVEAEVASSKPPAILGGSTPSEASIEWPENFVQNSGAGNGSNPVAAATNPAGAPLTKTVITYYLIKIPRRTENLSDLKVTNAQLEEQTKKKDSVVEAVQAKRAKRQELIEKLAEPRNRLRACREALQAKITELQPLQEELKALNQVPYEDAHLCKSEAELDAKIAELEHSMQHQTMSLREEKQVIRELQTLRVSRDQVVENEAKFNKKREALREREAFQARLKPLQAEVEALKRKRDQVAQEIKPLEEQCNALSVEITKLMEQKKVAVELLDGVYSERRNLTYQENAKNNDFFQNRRDILTAKQAAAAGDKDAVEQFCTAQVERVMDMWNNNPEFRSEYIKNNLRSTVRRLGTPDGRSLGPNETPITFPDAAGPSVAPPKKFEEKVVKEPTKPKVEGKRKVEAEDEPKSTEPATKPKSTEPVTKSVAEESRPKHVEKHVEPETTILKEEIVDPALVEEAKEKERERRRQEEMQKAREAEARKRKQAERKQAKAQLRLEKEEQRKEKEREKKQRKKPLANSVSTDSSPAETETDMTSEDFKVENGVLGHDKVEEKKPPTARRSGKGPSKAQGPTKNPVVKLKLKKKRSLQQQLYDNWQLILGVVMAVAILAGAIVVFVRS